MKSVKFILIFALLLPGFADAHGVLVGSEPPAGALLSVSPKQLRLRFSGAIEPALVKLGLTREGQPVSLASPPVVSDDGRWLTAKFDILAPGRYRVDWAVVAKDGHKTRGTFEFFVGGR
ncbi:MAG: copper resistance protein CopC [Betaproteobacteria bacterium]|nr:copper resistance protein CopC [Betaproteobacteria bacterium]